jgi:hypothetical protein
MINLFANNSIVQVETDMHEVIFIQCKAIHGPRIPKGTGHPQKEGSPLHTLPLQ